MMKKGGTSVDLMFRTPVGDWPFSSMVVLASMPKMRLAFASNQDYWKEKFNKNYVRDITKKAELQRLGWRVVVIWECELPDTRSDELARSLGL